MIEARLVLRAAFHLASALGRRGWPIALLLAAAGIGCGADPVEETRAGIAASCDTGDYPRWRSRVRYAVGDRVRYQDRTYEARQTHRAQVGWEPTATPALWHRPTPCDLQPWEPQTDYRVGSRVTHGGVTYACLQAHTSLPGWEPSRTPALWQAQASAARHRVDAFLFTDISACAIGDPCTTVPDECMKLWDDAHSTPLVMFEANDRFRVVPPGDPAIPGAAQVECLHMTLDDGEVANLRAELTRFRDNVATWSGGALDLELVIHELRQPVPISLSRWGFGVWLAPWDATTAVVPALSPATDFVLVSNAQHDRDRGLHFDLGGCGGTFGVDYGLGGASYSWVPRSRPFWFECAEESVYLHEWLHQVHYDLNVLSGFADLYHGSYPACGLGDPDTSRWFPDTHECNRDPDFERCGDPDCGGNDLVNAHVLQHHWPADRVLIANHCRDGVLDFDETSVDRGGRWCP